MDETCSPYFDRPRILPAWPCLHSEGTTIFVSQMQPAEELEPIGLPAREKTNGSRRMADFSIRSILALEGCKRERGNLEEPVGGAVEWGRSHPPYPWISCSRVKPHLAPKTKQAGSRSRPASRSPRVPFSATQLGTLENSFQQTRYLSTGQVREVALLLGLTENRVKIWFQNRRARERRDLLKLHPNSGARLKGSPLPVQSCLGWHA
nr:homeobox protein MSX-3-like [Pogona vitticeps]